MSDYTERYINGGIYSAIDYGTPVVSRGLFIAKWMLPMVKKTDKVLCVGCGVGYEVVEFLNNGIDTYGTELHDIPVPILKDRIFQGVIPGIPFKDKEYDWVVSCEVLEHIPEELTMPFLKECIRIGKQVVLTACTTPDGFNTHINVHPPQWWMDRLDELACKIITVQYIPFIDLSFEGRALERMNLGPRVLMYVRDNDIQEPDQRT